MGNSSKGGDSANPPLEGGEIKWEGKPPKGMLLEGRGLTPNPAPPKPLAARTRRSPAQLHARAWAVEPQDLNGWVGGKRKIGSNVASKILIRE